MNQSDLKDALHYDPGTGLFTWRRRFSNRVKIGDRAGYINIRRSSSVGGYVVIRVHGTSYLAHRLAWLYVYGRWPSDEIDHINKIRTDNRIANLREATTSQNRHNSSAMKKKGKSSRFKGVHLVANNPFRPWQASIFVGGKALHLGSFYTEEDAARAYDAAAKKHRGEFAGVNFDGP